jgi:hypothetical protein
VTGQKPRSRIVVFRLTDNEFSQLQRAAIRARRSLSEFTREGVLSAIRADVDRDATAVHDQLSDMQTVLRDMKELLRCMLSKTGISSGHQGVEGRGETRSGSS